MTRGAGLDAYKIAPYRQDESSWVPEVPAPSGCYALIPSRQETLPGVGRAFDMIAEDQFEKGLRILEDNTEIVSA